jgi:proteasome component ECM29
VAAVHGACDEETQQRLVAALVGALQGERTAEKAIKLDAESKVLDKGAITAPSFAGGSSVTTYKELCSMVTSLGQPDLLYKFMDLANHMASLKSKHSAAFSMARIAAQSLESIKPHVPALLPKLYRSSCAALCCRF